MAVISITNELDVLEKYNLLVQESLGESSVYIRTKETLDELFKDNSLKSTEKAQVISNVLGALNGSLVSTSMSTALQWAANEKDVALKKLELAKQLDILDQDKLLKEAQVDKMYYDSVAVQAQTRRMYGTPTVVDGTVTGLANEGKTYTDMQLITANTVNAGKEGSLLDSKLKESYATIHKVIADTYTNYGSMSYTLTDGGLISVVDNTPSTYDTLSDVQMAIAKQQANGYVYNAWANASTGSSSMIGTAIAAGFDDEAKYADLIGNVTEVINKLKCQTAPYSDCNTVI